MNTIPFRRHDLVWLDPNVDAGLFAAANQADLARDWVQQKFPLVVARQSDVPVKESNRIMLGFTLPSAPMRTRVSLCADLASVVRHSRPLLLRDAIERAPISWQTGLNRLLAVFEKTGTVGRVYGSMSSGIFTGRQYLDEASDLDLLLECGNGTKLHELIAALEHFPLPLPHIDGEILMPSGWAVAWRELAAALHTGTPRQVLAKSDNATRLMPLAEFTQPLLLAA